MLYYTAGINGGANLFSYCLNNPVMYTDPEGYFIVAFLVSLGLSVGAAWAVTGVVVAVGLLLLEMQTHIISDTLEWLWDTAVSIFDWTIEKIGDNIRYYTRKTPGIRDKSNSRKDAKEKAQRRGNGRPPRGPEDHGDGPHWHPNVPKGDPRSHDHYYFPDRFFGFSPFLDFSALRWINAYFAYDY